MATRSHQSPFSPSRSFSGAYCTARPQITHANNNSPSDCFAAGSIADCDEKENELDHHSSMRKAKNYMSPTISAASKFTPSPRKKVLSERNDPIPSSAETKRSAFLDSESSRNPAREMKNRKLETFLFSSDSAAAIIGTAKDQEEALPPYDPKTNILSPRPRFLRYKPNHGTDLLLNKEKRLDLDCFKQLEDNSMAEILSDKNNNLPDSVSVASSPCSSETCSVETPDREEEEQEQPHVSESCRIPDFKKNEKKSSWCFSRSMCCFVMLLTFMTAFTIQPQDLMTLSDFQQQYMNISSEQQNNIWDQKQYFINDGIKKLAATDIPQKKIPEEEFYEEVISDPVSSPRLEECRSHRNEPVPDLYESTSTDDTSMSEHGGEPEVEVASLPESDNWLVEATQEEVSTTHNSEIEKLIEHGGEPEVEVASLPESDNWLVAVTQEEVSSTAAAHDSEIEKLIEHGGEPEVEFETASIPESDNWLVVATQEEESTTAHDSEIDDEPHTNKHHATKAAYFILAAVTASMAVAFSIYHYKRRISCSAAPAETDKNAAAIGDNHTTTTYKEKLQTKRDETTSSNSKLMRSFPKTASYLNKDIEEGSEIQSSKRRESLASSTGGTPSYGSFTTFEKIPIKNASREEEIITPVRRSSRIRNKSSAISP